MARAERERSEVEDESRKVKGFLCQIIFITEPTAVPAISQMMQSSKLSQGIFILLLQFGKSLTLFHQFAADCSK